MFDGDDEVFLIVVVGTGSDLPLPLRFFGLLAENVEGIPFGRASGPQHTCLSRRCGGGLAQGLELMSFGLSLVVVLNGEKLINRLFD